MTIAHYAFLPWLRRGASNQIQATATSSSRAKLSVGMTLSDGAGDSLPVDKLIELVGPGDVLGINQQQIVRTEPRNWITDFEPNYLAFVDCYDEDFPWRYTPDAVAAATHRLRPWITLMVLQENEFTRNRAPGRPLFSIQLTGEAQLDGIVPPDNQLWAWAHVQLSGSIGGGTTPDLAKLGELLKTSADKGVSRLLSARRLQPNTAYYAFVIPTFETGRLAGLGEPVPADQPGLELSWATAREFPVYYEWYFRTGERGDFEELVRRLQPRDANSKVGIRDMDIRQPGFGIGDISNEPNGLVGLEGALLAPTSVPYGLAPTSNFPARIEPLVNAPADAVAPSAVGTDDPVVSPPLYGRWHALVERLDVSPEARNWVNQLNGDPRYRAASGLGTRVIQKNQEAYMKLAWQQIGDVLSANRKIAFVQLAMNANLAAYKKTLAALAPMQAVTVSAPVLARVLGSPDTLRHQMQESRLPPTAVAGAFRKMTRPHGLIARRAGSGRVRGALLSGIIASINAGRAAAAPPRPSPLEPTLEGAAEDVIGPIPGWLRGLFGSLPLLLLLLALLIVLLLAALMSLGVAAPMIGAILLPVTALALGLLRLPGAVETGTAAHPDRLFSGATAASASTPSTFAILSPEQFTPVRGAVADAATAADFKTALTNFAPLFETRPIPERPRPPFDLANAHRKVMEAVDPRKAHPRRLMNQVKIGDQALGVYTRALYNDLAAQPDALRVAPVMAYPDIKTPMYEPLRDISTELLVPNLDLIERNTLTLLIANQTFIEAYMVGLNHEFARELLWREYPTDQRGSVFRQFWDVSAYVDRQGLEARQLAEKLRDIRPIHTWPTTTQLGEHDNRAAESADGRIVLVIRGDLLKRYPNTIVYAQAAKWGPSPERTDKLVLWDETGEISAAGTNDPNIRYPLFKAEVRPDLHFVGFNLTLEQVRGDPALAETAEARAGIPASRLGWFFVLKEVVGEARFGLDENIPPAAERSAERWDNFAWENLGSVKRIDVMRPFSRPLVGSANTAGLAWGSNAADMAAILYQKPVMVAVHAREMLKTLTPVS